MSIIQQHTPSSLTENWRTINIDALDPDSSQNFPLSTLLPPLAAPTTSVQSLGAQIRQLLRAGDAEGALRAACLGAPLGGTEGDKDAHLQTVTEVLQSIRAAEMTPLLQRVYASEGGSEVLDALMKYLYKGMAQPAGQTHRAGLSPQSTGRGAVGGEGSGAAMSVLLSWHEKVVEVAGLGCVGRVMTDRRTV